jgi:hypothetical protein
LAWLTVFFDSLPWVLEQLAHGATLFSIHFH